MGALALLNHAINFLAPALWLALLVPLLARVFRKKRPAAHTLSAQVAINFVVCCGVLIAGLVLFGRDGKMLTYLGLVVMAASTQWWLQRR
ncbi:MAG: hypothetical protein IPN53_25360 [Comamonadaceae bacterium]|nr:hypothetical protein [Comamonadaceae bacterium]